MQYLRKSRTSSTANAAFRANIHVALHRDPKSSSSSSSSPPPPLYKDPNQICQNSAELCKYYVKCGLLDAARQEFQGMRHKDVALWTMIIASYSRNKRPAEALSMFREFVDVREFKLDSFLLTAVLPACGSLADLKPGQQLHAFAVKQSMQLQVFVGNALIDLYCKFSNPWDAWQVFDELPDRNDVSWSSVIGACVRCGQLRIAAQLLGRMNKSGFRCNFVTWNTLVAAHAQTGNLQEALNLARKMRLFGMEATVISWTMIVAGFCRTGLVHKAWECFQEMQNHDSMPNLVTWTAMAAGFAQNGYYREALKLVRQMMKAGISPNPVTVSTVLPACSALGFFQMGMLMHGYAIKSSFSSNLFVGNALIDMYSKCGGFQFAKAVFDKISVKDVVTWNSMITGLLQNGNHSGVLRLARKMGANGMNPDCVTLFSTLQACSSLPSLPNGTEIHCFVFRNGFMHDASVASGLIDMYAKCGGLQLALNVFQRFPISHMDVVVWTSMIMGYTLHGKCNDALSLYSQMLTENLKPDRVTFFWVLTACARARLLNEGWRLFQSMVQEYLITPTVQHYACMVDLIGHAGCLDKACMLVTNMPLEADVKIWGTLLNACKMYDDMQFPNKAKRLLQADVQNVGSYSSAHVHAAAV